MQRLLTWVVTFLLVCFMATGALARKKDDSKYDRPYDMIFESPQLWSVSISPDGSHLAMARRDGDNQFVIIQNLDDPTAKPAGVNLGDELKIQWVSWGNNNRVLYSVYKPWDGGLTSRSIVRMFGMDKDGKNNEQFFRKSKSINANPFIARPVSDLPNDPKHVLVPVRIGGDIDVLKVNVNNGDYELAAKGDHGTNQWYIDINGDPALYASYQEQGEVVEYYTRIAGTSGKNSKFKLAKTVKRDTTSNSTAFDFAPISPGPTATTYYVIARPDGANYAGIHLYDFEQNIYVKELYVPEHSDVQDAIFDESTGTYQGAVYLDHGKPRYALTDNFMQKHYDSLQKYFGEGLVIQEASASKDGKKLIFLASGPGKPGTYYLYDVDQSRAEELGGRMTNVMPENIATGRVVTYKARDGLELNGYLTQPTNVKPGEKAPLIVMPHGGPEARTNFGYSTITQFLNWKGYQVFEPNFRGSTGRGLEFADSGRRQWGRAMQNDVDDGFAYLVSTGVVDPGNACIMGFSYGGYAALAAATLTPGEYKCIIAGAGPADLFAMLKSEKSDGDFGYNYWTRHIGDINKDAADIASVSPAQLVANVTDPILLHHGQRDTTVPYEQGEIMKRALESAGKDFVWVSMARTGHWYPQEKGPVRNEFFDALSDFLDKYLPT